MEWLAARGIGRGDRLGIRMPSGSYALYVAILATLATGAAYVPVDADDPDERAELVFGEAGVVGVITEAGLLRGVGLSRGWRATAPLGRDDAWIIFTSGSTGTPKGVAVTHRSAAAFVDAEAQMFLQDNPIGPGDRVLAGLSVAFDASCEEMWLAWRHGACLVPAPRSLVRSGMDLGPWLVTRDVTVVSTVPALAALWPSEALEAVRLLIFGGEACPPELVERLAVDGREVWNTYGPTEATVVACAAKLGGPGPISIGLPLPGWDLAVVDGDCLPVAYGDVGELVIGGVGLARYLDKEKDAEKYAAMPSLGWARAYRSGDLVRLEHDGLYFCGRSDDQVKVGGRRIELGEVDSALVHLPGVSGGAAAVRHTATGTTVLVGYLVSADPEFDLGEARARLATQLPASLVPRLVRVDELPTRTSGKVDRDALPWPRRMARPIKPSTWAAQPGGWPGCGGTCSAPLRQDKSTPSRRTSSRSAAARWRPRNWSPCCASSTPGHRRRSVRPSAAGLARRVPRRTRGSARDRRAHSPADAVADADRADPACRSVGDAVGAAVVDVACIGQQRRSRAARGAVDRGGELVADRGGVRCVRHAVGPDGHCGALRADTAAECVAGHLPRGGSVHLRIWFTERLAEASGAHNLSGAPWLVYYARALGANIGKGVDLHSLPPVTGLLTLGHRCAIEPEVDLCGYWVDGDAFHVGEITIGNDATIGARSTLLPGAVVGKNADVAPGAGVLGKIKTANTGRARPR